MKSKSVYQHLAVLFIVLAASAQGQTSVSVANGRLSIATNDASQSIKIEVGPNAGNTRLFGLEGIPDGNSYQNIRAIDVKTGGGSDKVEVIVSASQNLSVLIDTGAGDAETNTKWKITPGIPTGRATLKLASLPGGNQKASVEIDSEIRNAIISVDTGNATDAFTKVNCPIPSDSLALFLNGRAPKTIWEVSAAAGRLDVNWNGRHLSSASDVDFSISQSRPAIINLNCDVVTSPRADQIEAKVAASGSNVIVKGKVNTGNGNDLLNFETDSLNCTPGLYVQGAGGDDTLGFIVNGRYLLSQTLGVTLLGEAGNDILRLTTSVGIYGTGYPRDINPVINGGTGFDLFNAFGRILNCEGRL